MTCAEHPHVFAAITPHRRACFVPLGPTRRTPSLSSTIAANVHRGKAAMPTRNVAV